MRNKKLIKKLFLGISLCLILIVMTCTINIYYSKNQNPLGSLMALNYDTSKYVYLSDINYETATVEPGYYLRLDKNASSGLINLNIKGEDGKSTKTPFIKGISAWATSEIVYDLRAYNYDYFTAYIGVDASQISTYYNGGVYFKIYTSVDGESWTEAYKSGLKKGWDNADKVEIDLSNVNYLKLYADKNGNDWWSMWYDDAIYANAKLVTKDYVEEKKTSDLIKTINEYDTEIKDKASRNEDYSLTLLKREFVSNVGYDVLQAYLAYSDEYANVINWLFSNKENLELYLLGGTPDGNYGTSLTVLNNLYQQYNSDLSNPLYKKMMITLSLTHSASVGSWISGAPEDPDDPNGSNALERYRIFKELYTNNLLNKEIFDSLTVEEMRFVMNNVIADEEIEWLNNLSRSENSTDPYHYIIYRDGYNYTKDIYYEEARKEEWDSKVRNDKNSKFKTPYNFTKYGLTYGLNTPNYPGKHPKLWMVFEEGSVCGGLSKTGSNIWGSYGVPSSVISQPGHAAYIFMSFKNGQKFWNLGNDVSGWGQSGKTEKLSVRMPNGWGTGSYVGDYPASYVILAQAALNDYASYSNAEETMMLAAVYNNDNEKLKSIYEEAISEQNINFDAWLGLVNTYVASKASDEELLELANRIVENLKYYPLPMHDLIRILYSNLDIDANKVELRNLIKDTLEADLKVTDNEHIQSQAVRQVANYLLNKESKMATFSFDGENAGKIILNDKEISDGVKWQYTLNSNDFGDYVTGLTKQLTPEEIEMIHEDSEIIIRFEGARQTTYTIPIEKSVMPVTISENDLENTLVGIDEEKMEWKMQDDTEWTKFKDETPDLAGNKVIEVRIGRYANHLASDPVTYTFTNRGEELNNKYVPNTVLSIKDVSSEELERERNDAQNVLDGNVNTMWHTLWDGSDSKKYITLELDNPMYVNALEYVPRKTSDNGIVLKAQILTSMDGENWTTAVESVSWERDNNAKIVDFENVTLVKYIKLVGVQTVGNYMSASLINLFEDESKRVEPTAEVEYSTKDLTRENVTATLVNPNRNIEVTNNGGSLTHTFTKNGKFTFEIKDDYGNTNKIEAEVSWIDKDAPEVTLTYDITSLTTNPVTVTLTSNEHITILNNDGKNTYTFTTNGEFEFEFSDDLGNTGKKTAKVSWIKEEEKNNDNTEKQDENTNVNTQNQDNNTQSSEQSTTSKSNSSSSSANSPKKENNSSKASTNSADNSTNENKTNNKTDNETNDNNVTDNQQNDSVQNSNTEIIDNNTTNSDTSEKKGITTTQIVLTTIGGISLGFGAVYLISKYSI